MIDWDIERYLPMVVEMANVCFYLNVYLHVHMLREETRGRWAGCYVPHGKISAQADQIKPIVYYEPSAKLTFCLFVVCCFMTLHSHKIIFGTCSDLTVFLFMYFSGKTPGSLPAISVTFRGVTIYRCWPLPWYTPTHTHTRTLTRYYCVSKICFSHVFP